MVCTIKECFSNSVKRWLKLAGKWLREIIRRLAPLLRSRGIRKHEAETEIEKLQSEGFRGTRNLVPGIGISLELFDRANIYPRS